MPDSDRSKYSFDASAGIYQDARPDYPDELIEDLVSRCNLSSDSSLLEIGPGSGKATLPLARRGLRITCVELGEQLAHEAARRLRAFPQVKVVHSSFESWDPPEDLRFDLIFAATAWHWVDPEAKYPKAWRLLRPDGHLAFWSATHLLPEDGDRFFLDIQDVYDEIGEGLPPGHRWPGPGELVSQADEIESSSLFELVFLKEYTWKVDYSAEAYIALLETFSGHIAMKQCQKERLYGEIRRRIGNRPEARVTRHWGALVNIARRRH